MVSSEKVEGLVCLNNSASDKSACDFLTAIMPKPQCEARPCTKLLGLAVSVRSDFRGACQHRHFPDEETDPQKDRTYPGINLGSDGAPGELGLAYWDEMNDQPVNVTDVVEEGVVEILQESPQNEGLKRMKYGAVQSVPSKH